MSFYFTQNAVSLERNQSRCALLVLVQGRRSLGSRRLERCGFGLQSLWFRYSPDPLHSNQ